MAIKNIYLDVCVLCRPFDDQNQMRIKVETDSYYLILKSIQNKKYQLVISPVHIEEISAIEEYQEKYELIALINKWGKKVKGIRDGLRDRADELIVNNFGIADAAHISYAEAISDCFISCDDGLLKKCKKNKLKIPVYNPIEFIIKEDLK